MTEDEAEMTEDEAEWLACVEPDADVLEFLRDKASDRKLRLFCCGCCRRLWHLLVEESSRIAVTAAENFADGIVNAEDLAEARTLAAKEDWAYVQAMSQGFGYRRSSAAKLAARAAEMCTLPFTGTTRWKGGDVNREWIVAAVSNAIAIGESWTVEATDGATVKDEATVREAAESKHACLLRDIIGNPFRPVAFEQGWMTATVKTLAQSIYQERAFDRLPILGDSLEDAGCTNQDVLDHCRLPGQHVKGCWVVDCLLGRE